MPLRTELVEQRVDGDRRVTLAKERFLVQGSEPIAMVRKYPVPPARAAGVVVLVHGYGQNRYAWHNDQRSFSAFLAAEGWDVFNIDLRGHGGSATHGSRPPRVLDEYVQEDLPACIREIRRVTGERVFLVGHSMGGLIAYFAAGSSLRDDVRGLVTLGSPYVFGVGSTWLVTLKTILELLRFTGALERNPRISLRTFGQYYRRFYEFFDNERMALPFRLWVPGSTEREILEEYLRKSFDLTNLAIAYDIARGTVDAGRRSRDGHLDYSAAFEWLDVPLFVIAGTRDWLVPPASVRPAFERSRASDKTYLEYPFGHIDLIVGRSAPQTVWTDIRYWLEKR